MCHNSKGSAAMAGHDPSSYRARPALLNATRGVWIRTRVSRCARLRLLVRGSATCIEHGKMKNTEVIEFPTVFIDTTTGEVVREFHQCVHGAARLVHARCMALTTSRCHDTCPGTCVPWRTLSCLTSAQS